MNTSDSLLNFAVLPSSAKVQTTTVITTCLCSCCVPHVGMWSKKPDEGREAARLPNTEQSTTDTTESKITRPAVAKAKGGLQAGLQRHHNATAMRSADVPPSQAEFCGLT